MLRYIKRFGLVVLDVGCGAGNFGALVSAERQAQVWGIELNDEMARLAAQKLFKVYTGDAEVLIPDLPDDTFDLICFNDSLEHLLWPETVLITCRAKLRSEGEVLCSIPNLRYFRVMYDLIFRKRFEYRDTGVVDRTHFRFFTADGMRKLFARCGYEIISFEGSQVHKKKRTTSWKYRVFQLITMGRAEDMKHLQYHVHARPLPDSD